MSYTNNPETDPAAFPVSGDTVQSTLPGTSKQQPVNAQELEKHVESVTDTLEPNVPDGEIVNVAVVTHIGLELNVELLAETEPWAEPANGSGDGYCQIRFPELPGNAKLYHTGKVVLSGPMTGEDIVVFVERIHYELRQLPVPTELHSVDVKNIVVKFPGFDDADNSRLNLNAVNAAFDEIRYEPAGFPGAFYNGDNGTCTLFSTGAVIVQGAASVEEAVNRKETVYDRLRQYNLLP